MPETLTVTCPDCDGAGELTVRIPPDCLDPHLAGRYLEGKPWRWPIPCRTCRRQGRITVVLVVVGEPSAS